jgi:hypothetical protein
VLSSDELPSGPFSESTRGWPLFLDGDATYKALRKCRRSQRNAGEEHDEPFTIFLLCDLRRFLCASVEQLPEETSMP